jgi:ABC-type uncharacterized transport system ATPase subunit
VHLEVHLAGVSGRAPRGGAADRVRGRPTVSDIELRHGHGVLAILGAPRDGTSLLLALVDGGAKPSAGTVRVGDTTPEAMRTRIARVSHDAPLPDGLRIDEICRLAAQLRSEPHVDPATRLAVLGAGALASRRVATLSLEERRTVALAIALTSKADVLLLEEPLAGLDPVAPRLVVQAIRERASTATILVTTASFRDASQLGDRLGRLVAGRYQDLEHGGERVTGPGELLVVLAAASGTDGASRLAAVLSREPGVVDVETKAHARPGEAPPEVTLVARGGDVGALARAMTRAIAEARVNVVRIERSPSPPSVIASGGSA